MSFAGSLLPPANVRSFLKFADTHKLIAMHSFFRIFLLTILPLSFLAAQPLESRQLKDAKFRFIGPDGNRAIAIAGIPGNPLVTYIGAASGGLWKTEDGGTTWNPIFDNQEVSSISALAVAPSAPEQVWVGTGETFVIRPAHAMGEGIFKSADGGKTFTKMGLELSGRIGRIVVHPTNPDIVYAAALGHTYGPQQERGVYRTTDGGKNWERVLFVDENTGAIDLALNPENPSVLFAGMWSVHINTWGLNSGGPGGGVFRTEDGGDSWTPMAPNGLPGGRERPVGKVAVAIAPSSPSTIYALFEIESPALYRSQDNGASWELMSRDHDMNERAPYYCRIAVAPDNPDELYFLSVRFCKSVDGGKTLTPKRPPCRCGDTHDMWIDPSNPDRMMVADDACAVISNNRGKTWERVVLPIAQMYHVAVDDQVPYNVYGNRQDGYSYRGPSNSLQSGIPIGMWKAVGGCESGFAKPDPFDNNIIYSGCYDGGLERFDLHTGHAREVRVWPEAAYGWEPAALKYRWHWNFPMSFSPHIPHRIYVGSQYVHLSDDGGNSWETISPDLTLNRKDHQKTSGGVAVDNLMTFDGATLFAIEESPLEPGLIWVGTNDGQVQMTTNYGKQWTNLTANLPNLPPWGTISCISPSRHQKGTAYIAIDLHQMADFEAYVYKTEDYGKSWKKISDSVPKSVHSFAHVIKEDPRQAGILFLGVDNGIWVSVDDGNSWTRLRNGLPPAPVYWLEIQEHFDDLVVATYGRGFYILDDISFIRETVSDPVNPLLPLRPAYRFNQKEVTRGDAVSFVRGRNPAYGANIDYLLPQEAAPGEVSVEILDADNQVIRTLKGKTENGFNRLYWNLRRDSPEKPKLRTLPPGREWVTFNEEGWRPLVTWDLDLVAGQRGPRVAPGHYTVLLKVDDEVFEQTLEVKKDPHSTGTLGDIKKQVRFIESLQKDLNRTVALINELEIIRMNLQNTIPAISSPAAREEAQQVLELATGVAAQLYDIHLTGAREDAFRAPMKLYGRISALASDINGNGVDFRPTEQQQEVYDVLRERLETADQQYSQEVLTGLDQLNQRHGLGVSRKLVKP